MLIFSLRFATSKMLIYFQKRFVRLFSPDGDLCLFSLCEWATVQSTGFQMASDNFGRKRLFWSLLRRPFVSNTVWPRAKLGGVVLRGQASKQSPQNYLKPWFFFGYFLFIKKKKVTYIICISRNPFYLWPHKSNIPWIQFIWHTTTLLYRSCLCACAGKNFDLQSVLF